MTKKQVSEKKLTKKEREERASKVWRKLEKERLHIEEADNELRDFVR